ncbi:hypothetical protein UCD39_09160 [Nitrospirillum sp. BR 11752]|uniref:hypothetical protein n=1 Tax=Nitrospirillum sp. BR 11752 TaxID=3104293 RepID=UPI002EC3C5DD|nr:hypothetical protein [Nitrospirillum sp. BR 11752]
MGIAYTVSPLRRIGTLDTEAAEDLRAAPAKPSRPGEQFVIDLILGFPAGSGQGRVLAGPPPIRYPVRGDIINWRDRLAVKYRVQLDEVLTWNEDSPFSISEEPAASADLLLRYVAAIVDEKGAAALKGLVAAARPDRPEIDRALKAADQRGFTGRFPQLLLTGDYWLPFRRNMIIEDLDWWGRPARFGSVTNLLHEVTELRTVIRTADPTAARHRPDERPEAPLATAWQASETLHHVAKVAVDRHLPLWLSS